MDTELSELRQIYECVGKARALLELAIYARDFDLMTRVLDKLLDGLCRRCESCVLRGEHD